MMLSRNSRYALVLLAFLSVFSFSRAALAAQVVGYIDGVDNIYGQYVVVGWACVVDQPTPINVELYVGGPPGTGTEIGNAYPANFASEPGVAAACNSTGTGYRYQIPLAYSTLLTYGGKAIYVNGVSPDGQSSAILAQSGTFNVPAAPATGSLTIAGTPSPCIATAAGPCTSTITWNAYGPAQIWLQVDGQPNETLFACNASGTQAAPWIQAGHTYTFSMYQATSCSLGGRGAAINSVSIQGVPVISGNPSPCPMNQAGQCTVTINWNSYGTSQVWLQVDGQATDKLFACGIGGTAQAPWILPTHRYVFSVYQASSCAPNARTGTALGSVTIRGTLNGNCGAADEVMTGTAPSANLCATGTPSQISGAGPWMWSCSGADGGVPAFCVAPSSITYLPQNYAGIAAGCGWSAAQDVAPCIQAALNDASKTGGTVSVPQGQWNLGNTLSLPSNVTLQGASAATTTLQPMTANTSDFLLLTGRNIADVLVRNITFDGGGPDFSNPSVVAGVTTGNYIMFDKIAVQNTHGIGLLLQGGITNSGVKNSSFINIGNHWKTTLQRADRIQGLVFCCGTNTNNFATGNNFQDIGLDALQPANQVGFTAMYNAFNLENNQRTLVPSPDYASGIFPLQSSNVLIGYNTITGAQGNGIDAPGLQNSAIFNNSITNSGGAGLGLFLGYDGTTQSTNVTVSNNQIMNNEQWGPGCFMGGIALGGGIPSYIDIANNTVTDTQAVKTQRYGIHLVEGCGSIISTFVQNMTISGNNLTGNSIAPLDNFFQYCTQNCIYSGL